MSAPSPFTPMGDKSSQSSRVTEFSLSQHTLDLSANLSSSTLKINPKHLSFSHFPTWPSYSVPPSLLTWFLQQPPNQPTCSSSAAFECSPLNMRVTLCHFPCPSVRRLCTLDKTQGRGHAGWAPRDLVQASHCPSNLTSTSCLRAVALAVLWA